MDRIVSVARLTRLMAKLPDADTHRVGDRILVPYQTGLSTPYGKVAFVVRRCVRGALRFNRWIYEGKIANKGIISHED